MESTFGAIPKGQVRIAIVSRIEPLAAKTRSGE